MNKRTLNDYIPIVGQSVIDEIRMLAEKLRGKKIKMINSTAVGGGVAEILHRLVPLFVEAGVDMKWEVIKGSEAFFAITKTMHNALHGKTVEFTNKMMEIFLAANRENAETMRFDEDIIIIHDPQPVALVEKKLKSDARWLWRCHIDLSSPYAPVWKFLHHYVKMYDGAYFSSPKFSQKLAIPQYLLYPSIDPLSDKNRDIPQSFIDKTLRKYDLDPHRPIITQISRFDYLKDPVGVIEAYKMVKKKTDCQLVLAGGGADDDPEASQVLNEVKTHAAGEKDIHILELPPFSDLEINALQRASRIIIQKSLKEGFALTVAEGLWKGVPVIGSAVGGIPLQIIHNFTGVLVHSIEGAAYQIRYLLSNPDFAKRLGQFGKELVREKYVTTSHLRNYLLSFIAQQYPEKSIIEI